MYFDATPTNMTEMLVIVPAIISIVLLMKKHYDTNMPLVFFLVAMVFTNMADRPIDPYLMYGSMAMALFLRFEFMSSGISKFVAFCTMGGMVMIIWTMMQDVLA